MANFLTAIRLLSAVPFAYWMGRAEFFPAACAAVAILIAIATDLLDGHIARRRGTESAGGRLFDHSADFLFVTSGLAAAAMRGALPLALPALIAVAFAQYVLDSYWLDRRGQLRMSGLGRYNGVLYFVPVCGDVLVRLGAGFLAAPVRWVAWLLVASTLISIADRLVSLRSRRKAPGSSDAGTAARFQR